MNELNKVHQLEYADTDAGEGNIAHKAFCQAYRRRDLAISVVVQLNHLTKDIQQHRGITMGLLAGNRAFEGDFSRLQRALDRRLATLEAFVSEDDGIFTESDKVNVQMAWDSIRCDWQEDKLSDNFELHCHFIDQLHQINLSIAKAIDAPILGDIGERQLSTTVGRIFADRSKQIELLNFTCSLLPSMIETMAKIRGLASFSAAMGSAQYQHDRKLRFLVKCAREQNEKLRQCAQRLNEVLNGEFSANYVIGELETKFVHFLELVIHDVLSGRPINSSSSQLFSLASDLVDRYWNIVDEGIELIRIWHRADIEAWINL